MCAPVIPEKIGWKSLTSGADSGMIKVRLRIDPQLDREKEFISEKIEKKFDEEKWEQFEIFAIWEKKRKK